MEPVDVSLTGLLVRSAPLDWPKAKPLSATLELRGDRVTLSALLMRQQDGLVALHFPESVRHGQLNPPKSLLAIYRNLELAFLKQRSSD